MTKYQLTFLISLKIEAEQINQYQEKIIDQIKQLGAEIDNISETREQVLAYPIKGEKKVWLTSLTLRSEPDGANKIESILAKEDLVLRSMISIVPKEKPRSAPRRPMSRQEKEAPLKEVPVEPKIKEDLDQKINEILNWE